LALSSSSSSSSSSSCGTCLLQFGITKLCLSRSCTEQKKLTKPMTSRSLFRGQRHGPERKWFHTFENVMEIERV
jgi:hypothetical protein